MTILLQYFYFEIPFGISVCWEQSSISLHVTHHRHETLLRVSTKICPKLLYISHISDTEPIFKFSAKSNHFFFFKSNLSNHIKIPWRQGVN